MTSWVNLDALWKIVVIGLLCGAGLPAVFAIGLRALHVSDRRTTGVTAAVGAQASRVDAGTAALPAAMHVERRFATRNMLGVVVAGICFAVVLAAIGWGVAFIVSNG
jgi:hypothetical protein